MQFYKSARSEGRELGRIRPRGSERTTCSSLREITRADVTAVLNTMARRRRNGSFVALRSLFGFAERRRLIFAEPTRYLHIGGLLCASRYP